MTLNEKGRECIIWPSSLLLADSNTAGLYGPYATQESCSQAGKRFADTGLLPSGTRAQDQRKTLSFCTQLHKVN